MRTIDFSSWQSVLATMLGLALVTLIGVGIRLLTMMTIQQRRERMNRQINERLRTLIAAYKTLGGSFTGTLTVDPAHLRDLRRREGDPALAAPLRLDAEAIAGSDRGRRIRDAVEAALSDIILLGTDEQVRLAVAAAHDLVAGRPVPTHDLVVSLRNFVRAALDLQAIPRDLVLPAQGPTRPAGTGGRGKSDRDAASAGRSGGAGAGGMATGGGVPDGGAGDVGDPSPTAIPTGGIR
ncbi:hypothetical protein ASE75_12535 [Sphingomonas sp. Leaf17]|uniref:hypothetical protein n=1 Tax=Sphingomonas sp. Leaf17 TaxID=1735683 RepID=UPI0006F5A142|nr:hypothetical protein [Sphingomonas sp. Leaf17]KQM63293.1 hypothetical protein ASE75_12535 [Sphingomonas sp. Leaf17]